MIAAQRFSVFPKYACERLLPVLVRKVFGCRSVKDVVFSHQDYQTRKRDTARAAFGTARIAKAFETVESKSQDVGKGAGDNFEQLHPFWKEKLGKLQRRSALTLVPQIDVSNVLGFPMPTTNAARSLWVLTWLINQKKKRPCHIHLVRIGDFFEAVGVDALILVEHCGLRPMANKLRAGFPAKAIQETLDQLTQQGFSVAVYEELNQTMPKAQEERSYKQRKVRTLAQIVSPMAPLYLHNLSLKEGSLYCHSWKPVAAILFEAASGFQLVEIDVPLKRVTVDTGLTLEGLIARLYALAPASPLYIHHERADPMHLRQVSRDDRFLFQNGGTVSLTGIDAISRKPIICRHDQFLDTVLRTVCYEHDIDTFQFKVTRKASLAQQAEAGNVQAVTRLRDTAPNVARQIGISASLEIPSLMSTLLPRDAPPYVVAFLRRWLLSPPPFYVTSKDETIVQHTLYAMQQLCRLLSESSVYVPTTRVVSPQKIAILVEKRQCNADTFREIAATVRAAEAFLAADKDSKGTNGKASAMLWTILRQQHDFLPDVDMAAFRASMAEVLKIIESIVLDGAHADEPRNRNVYAAFQSLFYEPAISMDTEGYSSMGFCERKELAFRHRVRRESPNIPFVEQAYTRVESNARALLGAALVSLLHHCNEEDCIKALLSSLDNKTAADQTDQELKTAVKLIQQKKPLKYNILTHHVYIRGGLSASMHECPTKSTAKVSLQPAINRKGKYVTGGLTSDSLDFALSLYNATVDEARAAVQKALLSLCVMIEPHIRTLFYASTLVTVAQAAKLHVDKALDNSWCLPELEPLPFQPQAPSQLQLEGITPYWLPRNSRRPLVEKEINSELSVQNNQPSLNSVLDESVSPVVAVPSDLSLDGITLLTAPNMAGKSSLLRAIAAVALLGSCGLYVPCTKAKIPRLDGIYMQIATTDVPTEGRSSFGQEMASITTILQEATSRSLVLLDELGHGTSHDAAVSIAGAVVEKLLQRGCLGVFSTHLHQLFDVGLDLKNANVIHMDYDIVTSQNGTKDIIWNYRVAKGRCDNSFGLLVARHFGLPEDVLSKAKRINEQYFNVEHLNDAAQ